MDSDSEPPDFKSRPLLPCSRIPPTENYISTEDSEWGSADLQRKCLTLKKRLWSDTGLMAERDMRWQMVEGLIGWWISPALYPSNLPGVCQFHLLKPNLAGKPPRPCISFFLSIHSLLLLPSFNLLPSWWFSLNCLGHTTASTTRTSQNYPSLVPSVYL